MSSILLAILWLAIAIAIVPAAILCAEVTAAAVARRGRKPITPADGRRPAVDVIVPAHDEEVSLAVTLASIQAQLALGDRLTVVADNCIDDTAGIAERLGADVLRRQDPARRGKGFALEHGLAGTAASGREIVVIVDADCLLGPGCLDRLARACAASRRPVQALYRMDRSADPSPDSSPKLVVHRFAWDLKNRIRPLGLRRLGGPCQLMGTGMAFPRSALAKVTVGSANIVEDLQLGLDLCRAGHPPLFLPEAVVESAFPPSAAGLSQQHERWQRGSVRTLLVELPRCLHAAVRHQNAQLLYLAADLAVPPVVMLGTVSVLVAFCAALLGTAYADPAIVTLGLVPLLLVAIALALAWRTSTARGSGRAAARILPFLVGRLLSYPRGLLSQRASVWIRSERPNGPRP